MWYCQVVLIKIKNTGCYTQSLRPSDHRLFDIVFFVCYWKKFHMLVSFFYIVFFVCSVSLLCLVREKGLVRKFFSPFGFYLISFSLIFFLVPVWQLSTGIGRFPYLLISDNEYMLLSAVALFVYLLSSFLVYLLFLRPKVDFDNISKASLVFDSKSKNATIFCYAAFFLGLLFFVKTILPYAALYNSFMIDRINILSGYGYPLMLLSFSLPLVLLVFLKNQAYFINYKVILLILVIFFVYVFMGSRSSAVIVLPYIFLAYILADHRSRLKFSVVKKVVVAMLGLLLIVSILSGVREAAKEGGVEKVLSGNYFSEGKSLQEIYISQISGNYGHSELLAFAIMKSNEYEKALGHTFLAGFVSFIPRAIWEDKPVGGGPMLANIVAPGAYKLRGKEGNSSLTTGLPIEGYLNFGFLGMLLLGSIHGFLLVLVTIYSKRIRVSIEFVIYLILFHRISLVMLTGEFLGVFSGLIFILVPLYLFSKICFFKESRSV